MNKQNMLTLCLGFGLARGDRLHDGPKKRRKKIGTGFCLFPSLALRVRFLDKTGLWKFGNAALPHAQQYVLTQQGYCWSDVPFCCRNYQAI